ncbi:MAG: PhzF family phenazine biosynthesis protein [Betaproteobacteria bacterium]
MSSYRFQLINVFAESPLTGNALCVFEDARGLDDATMQALALQFNLSETTFILPSQKATAKVRIFTPTFEMPFAGHPTLGTSHVVREVLQSPDSITLEMTAGLIPVSADGDAWTLSANPPTSRPAGAGRTELAEMLRLAPDDIGEPPLWVDTGSEQLIVPLMSADAVRRAEPDASTLADWPRSMSGRAMCYVWAHSGPGTVESRFFFSKHSSVIEDPGTGSACANLGGWMLATHQRLPIDLAVSQGAAVGRPCKLKLSVSAEKQIRVSGRVIVLGSGSIDLP